MEIMSRKIWKLLVENMENMGRKIWKLWGEKYGKYG
jgi:hypothetical protein